MQIIKSSKIIATGLFLLINFLVTAQQLETSIFVTGNTGEASNFSVLNQIIKESQSLENSRLMILGNSVPEQGFTENTKSIVKNQLDVVSKFNGEVIFTSGNHEWASKGHRGLRDLEKFIQKNSDAKFYPDKGDAIKHTNISDNVVLITIDTQWFLEDWNKDTYINDSNEIKNRTLFFLEFENRIKKAHGKIVLVALHHPVETNTKQGLLSNIGGIHKQDFENKQYRLLRDRLKTIAQGADHIIFVSGSDKNLQYINDEVPQIISGAAGKTKGVSNVGEDDFGIAENGYAKLEVNIDGTVGVKYYTVKNDVSKVAFQTNVLESWEDKKTEYTFDNTYPKEKSASIYTKEETKKSFIYKTLWGKHYRPFYGTEVKAPVVLLDTLMGGLSPIKRGGGQQSKSLRLEDKDGKQFVMRAIKKSTTKFLQTNLFPNAYISNSLDNTAIDKFLSDFYTTSNPYAPFIIDDLSEEIGVNHTNPVLYYIPKQETLGVYNEDFGDELYMIEEHVGSTQTGSNSFGKPQKIIGTADVLQEIYKTGISTVDEPSYIKARLFDMLLGDWDRHEDQWRWAFFDDGNGNSYYKPIPRDRDQAFSKYDGSLISFITRVIPNLRKMQSYDDDVRSVKWLADSPYHLDLILVNSSGWEEWEKQAKFIQENLSDEDIEKAFEAFPPEIKGEVTSDIKEKLKGRRLNLTKIAKRYFEYLNKFEVLIGTQKSDKFHIQRLPNGNTAIKIEGEDVELLERTFGHDVTKEIWIYGLDGKDTFLVDGDGNDLIKIRIVGGKKNDTYDFKNTKKVKLYDYKSKENTIVNKSSRKWLVDDYDINNYDHKKVKHKFHQVLPLVGFNPDDGVKLGAIYNYMFSGLQRNKFTYKHSISAAYYTGNSGYDVSYKGEVSNIFHNWNFGIEGKFTSPNFAQNFFGFGNGTEYDKDEVDLDFNRVSIEELSAAISLIWRGENGGSFYVKPLIETFEVDRETDRFINILPAESSLFENQTYLGGEVNYSFKNVNDTAYPTMGLDVAITGGYKTAIDGDDIDNEFGYVKSHIAIHHRLNKSASLVLASKIGGEAILGDNFELYHAAQLGGVKSLRGFRKERFAGEYSAFHSTDLRLRIGNFNNGIIPSKYGITGGFDYGRVWFEDDTSDEWHTNVGGSIWISGLDTFTLNAGYYGSDDGGIISFTLGFAF